MSNEENETTTREMTTTCIICNTTWTTNKILNGLEDKEETEKKKMLLYDFCRHYGVPLPMKSLEFNFENDDEVPFCSSCQNKAESVIQSRKQMDSLKSAIQNVERTIKNHIFVSSTDADPVQVKDKRTKIIRDMILGLSILKSTASNLKISQSDNPVKNKRIRPVKPINTAPPLPPLERSPSPTSSESSKEGQDPDFEIDFEPQEKRRPKSTNEPKRKRVRSKVADPEAEKDKIKIVCVEGKEHTYSYGDFEFEKSPDGKFHCSTCPQSQSSGRTKHRTIEHIRRVHMKLEEPKTHLCATCGRAFSRSNDLQKHTLTAHTEFKVLCHLCGGAYKSPDYLSKHMATIHGQGEFTCEFDNCGKVFVIEKLYLRHIRKVHKNVPRDLLPSTIKFCPFCTTSFIRKGRLEKHIQKFHSLVDGQPPRPSEPYVKKVWIPLPKRKRVPSEPPPPDPNAVPKRTRRKRGKKPQPDYFECALCGVRYTRKTSLREHEIKVHNAVYKRRSHFQGPEPREQAVSAHVGEQLNMTNNLNSTNPTSESQYFNGEVNFYQLDLGLSSSNT